jgi:hypothetical protein
VSDPAPDEEPTREDLQSLMRDHLIEVRRLGVELVPEDDHTGCHMIHNAVALIALRSHVKMPDP